MTKTGSLIRPAVPSDYPDIANLLDRVMGRKPYELRLALWKWRYEDNPARTDAFPPFFVLEQGGRISGAHGLIPLRVQAGKEQLSASCSCDLAIDPSARSAGMKLKLKVLGKECSPLHLSTSANEPANRITLALGGREVHAGRRTYLKPLKASGLLGRRWGKERMLSRIAGGAVRAVLKPIDWILAAGQPRRSFRHVTGAAVREINRFDERYDRLWERFREEHEILVIRDSGYLNWRYSRYPFPGIQSFELSRGRDLLGFSVIHISVDEDSLRFASLLELVGLKEDERALGCLLREAVRRARRGGAHYLVAKNSAPFFGGLLGKNGFWEREMAFSPVTYRNNSRIPDAWFEQDRNWYLSLGDGDACHYFDSSRERET